jgi:hypothetical protein
MIRANFLSTLAFSSLSPAQETLRAPLETTYNAWRQAISSRDYGSWERATASHRLLEDRNRII